MKIFYTVIQFNTLHNFYAKTAHGLVAEAEARRRIASHDEAPPPYDLAILIDGEDAGPERLAGAAGENAEVVSVLEVLGKHDIAEVEKAGSWETEKYHTPQGSWNSLEMLASRMRRY
jgi:hypothetical protein